ncbi:MAG: hypothetical protein JSV88_01365 [Candidatus Aminicenantes bacterium]|nr:MAG: hypothetical protein JSV88_01365 [Candidatus Aminicenantes bacterium]
MSRTKIAVLSDSHDNADNLEKVAFIANDKNGPYLFHLNPGETGAWTRWTRGQERGE